MGWLPGTRILTCVEAFAKLCVVRDCQARYLLPTEGRSSATPPRIIPARNDRSGEEHDPLRRAFTPAATASAVPPAGGNEGGPRFGRRQLPRS